MVEAGLRSLRWLVAMQTAPEGHFRPVGSHGFLMTSRNSPEPFDQQPLEACATIAACIAAKGVDPDSSWRDRKSVVSGKRVSVRVDLGGRRIIKKDNTEAQR